jgi:type IX secretion system PorP/SprF family membrane protein
MNIMVKRFIIVLGALLIGSWSVVKAQDAHFSQFYANSLYLNPAFAGAEKCPKLSLNYRNQWPALGPTYVTYSAAYDQYLNVLQGGVGLHLMNDIQGGGTITTTMISGMYAYTLPVTRKFFVAGGFQVSYIMKTINWDFVFPNMIHPLYGPIYSSLENPDIINNQRNYVDFSTGLLAFSERTFFGLAVHHLTQPSESFLRGSDAVLPRKISVHFGTEVPINSSKYRRGELKISPQLLFHQQGQFQQFNWGVYVARKQIVAGFWLRQNFNFQYDSFIMLAGFKQDNLRFAYSYDMTVSRLKNSTYGAHEVSVAFTFTCPEKNIKKGVISCPMF